jgi:hypothetical protein
MESVSEVWHKASRESGDRDRALWTFTVFY